MFPVGTEATPSTNGWHGAANGWVAVLRHPLGDQKRLCTCTILLGAFFPPAHVTRTVIRYGEVWPVVVVPAVTVGHPVEVVVGQLSVSYARHV